MYKSTNIDEEKHCFFSSKGGVSKGKYASLNTNLCSKDDRINVEKNFDIIAEQFAMKRCNMVTIRQGFSNKAVFFDESSWFIEQADGIVVKNENLLIGIKTADCAPVLLADYKNGVIGAAHAGWRGTYRGIVENVVSLMLEKGAQKKHICAAIGPCLQQKSFVVKQDVLDCFLKLSPKNEKYFVSRETNDYLFDLSGYLMEKLYQEGIENVKNSKEDTYPADSGYFSYRRNMHRNLVSVPKDYPTQFSCLRL